MAGLDINRNKLTFLHYKIIGAPKKFKHQSRPLVRPSSLNFGQNFEIYLMGQSLLSELAATGTCEMAGLGDELLPGWAGEQHDLGHPGVVRVRRVVLPPAVRQRVNQLFVHHLK
jgi:hypothetical protein